MKHNAILQLNTMKTTCIANHGKRDLKCHLWLDARNHATTYWKSFHPGKMSTAIPFSRWRSFGRRPRILCSHRYIYISYLVLLFMLFFSNSTGAHEFFSGNISKYSFCVLILVLSLGPTGWKYARLPRGICCVWREQFREKSTKTLTGGTHFKILKLLGVD